MKLVCTKCGKNYSLETPQQRCDCGAPLEVETMTGVPREGRTIWERYQEFFPLQFKFDYSLGEGNTPLSKAQHLSNKLNVKLYLKNETTNPTWSFKDRGTFVGIHQVLKLGMERIGTVSTGNMAESVAAYGTHFDFDTTVLVSADISDEKLVPIAIHDPRLIKVRGDYGQLYYRSLEVGRERDIYFINSDNPFRIEGYKTISFEIAEEKMPDYVIVPTSSGGLFRGMTKGFIELKKRGIIEILPTMVCVQAEGCAPIYQAFKDKRTEITRVEHPHTIAHAIANPYPPSGNDVLRKLRKYDGICTAVSDEAIFQAQKDLAREGIFVQPASTVGIAALKKLRKSGYIKANAKVVCILTGAGLKDLGGVKEIPEPEACNLKDLQQVL